MKSPGLLGCCCAVLLGWACSSGDSPGELPPPSTELTVSGTVKDAAGHPRPGVRVLILGNDRVPVTTDESGAFSFSDVTTPYDLALVQWVGTQDVIVYQGVTRRDLTVYVDPGFTPAQARVQGTVIQADGTSSSVNPPLVAFASPEVSGGFSAQANTGAFSTGLRWGGPAVITGTLYALQLDQGFVTVPTRYLGFGRRDGVMLTDGATLTGQDVQLGPVDSALFDADFSVPSGYEFNNVVTSLMLPPNAEVQMFLVYSASAPDYVFPVPAIPEGRIRLTALALTPDIDTASWIQIIKSGLTPDAQRVEFVFKEPPQLGSPEPGLRGVTHASEFSWSVSPDNVYGLEIGSTAAAGPAYSMKIYTAAARTTIPDLRPLGIHLPGNTEFSWKIRSYSPMRSVEDLLDYPGHDPFSGPSERVIGTTRARTFTTAITP